MRFSKKNLFLGLLLGTLGFATINNINKSSAFAKTNQEQTEIISELFFGPVLDSIPGSIPEAEIREPRRVAVFSGHTTKRYPSYPQGALSATGRRESSYNDAVVSFFDDLPEDESRDYNLVFATESIHLEKRVALAEQMNAELYIEVHHDGPADGELEKAIRAGRDSPLWNRLSGFSLHIFSGGRGIKAEYYRESRRLAELIGDEFLNLGYKPNSYIGFKSPDKERGIYHRSLRVLRDAGQAMPAVLVEIGNIVNPYEEAIISQRERQREFTEAIDRAVRNYFLEQELETEKAIDYRD